MTYLLSFIVGLSFLSLATSSGVAGLWWIPAYVAGVGSLKLLKDLIFG